MMPMPIDPNYRETWRIVDRDDTCEIWRSPEDESVIHGTRVGVHLDSCTFCLKCLDVCPTDVFERYTDSEGRNVILPTRQSECIDCLACEMVCDVDAISVESRAGSESTLKALLDGE